MRAKKNEVRVTHGELYAIEYRKKGQWFWRVYAYCSRSRDVYATAKRIAEDFDHTIAHHEKREKPIYFEVKP